MALLDGRTVLITGAGRGIGRAEALLAAREGASVVVNDLGCDEEGDGTDPTVAEAVVRDITGQGGQAVAHTGDVTNPEQVQDMVDLALSTTGRLDAVINSAGVLRDWMSYNLPFEDWQRVIDVHLTGAFLVSQAACRHWRECARRKTGPTGGQLLHTTSASGLFGNKGQANYGAAKAGVAAMTQIIAMEMQRYDVMVNAIAPGARTRMTEGSLELPGSAGPDDYWSPDNIAPLAVYLVSPQAGGITGQVFGVRGSVVELLQGWSVASSIDRDRRWSPDELAGEMATLFGHRPSSYERQPLVSTDPSTTR
jgi:NAD(P)-dependent dehydrogenase (short-subunit alcohol dehydrogenase family)